MSSGGRTTGARCREGVDVGAGRSCVLDPLTRLSCYQRVAARNARSQRICTSRNSAELEFNASDPTHVGTEPTAVRRDASRELMQLSASFVEIAVTRAIRGVGTRALPDCPRGVLGGW